MIVPVHARASNGTMSVSGKDDRSASDNAHTAVIGSIAAVEGLFSLLRTERTAGKV